MAVEEYGSSIRFSSATTTNNSSNISSCNRIHKILSNLSKIYIPAGFELYPFKIGWYNNAVEKPFQFDLDPDTLAFIIISTPDMFDKALIPFICQENFVGSEDLLDTCMRHYFSLAKEAFSEEDIETMHDFEMTHSRRPKILVQPAAHIAGAAYYYTRRALDPDPFEQRKKICGVNIHPKYGGWFAIRGAIVFKSIVCPELESREPVDCVPEQDKRVQLLELFNYHWQDWRFRDIIEPQQRYSDDQKAYFETIPKDRKPLIRSLREKYLNGAFQKCDSMSSEGNGNVKTH